ncbi:MAG: biopolymer transporter ExbD [Deltaproteobacteria bacterium]|nr:biopolymer transporter ExbD [Deltaproteobacteria bacterium]
MSTGRRGGNDAISDINVTPLVDVMLVLLIIFMVAAPLISQGVPVALPKTQAQPLEGDESKLVLTVTKEKKIFIGSNAENPIKYEELEEKLKTNDRLQREKELYLHADRALEYGVVVDIMAIIKRAGVTNLGMVTDPTGPE